MKIIILSLVLCLLAGAGAFSASFEEACRVMSAENTVSGDFIQKRTIAANGRSLKSSGVFTVSKGEIIWQTTKPIKSTVQITEGKITSTDSKGHTTVLDSTQNQMFTLISKMMASLFAGNRSELESFFLVDFDGSAEGDASKWKMTLTPRDSTIAQAVSHINLSGNLKFMLTMESVLTGGDSILYEFYNHKIGR